MRSGAASVLVADTPEPEDSGASDRCDVALPTPQDVAADLGCPDPTGPLAILEEWALDVGAAYGPPLVAQLDGAGPPEVIVTTNENQLVVAQGDGSAISWVRGPVDGTGAPSLADLDADGQVEVIAQMHWDSGYAHSLRAWDADGREIWTTVPMPDDVNWTYGTPSVDDLDGDGSPEIVAGRVIFHADGSLRGAGAQGRGAMTNPWLPDTTYGGIAYGIDLDGDGAQEVLAGNTAYDAEGNTLWHADGVADGHTAAADFDGDGEVEIVLVSVGELWGLTAQGAVEWGPVAIDGGCEGQASSPAVDDLDGDGAPEIVVACLGLLTAYEWGGDVAWTSPIDDPSCATGPAIGDLDGDGWLEVAIADHTAVRVFAGSDGSLRWSDSHASNTGFETPSFADADGDGDIELLVGGFEEGRGLVAYGLAGASGPGRPMWSQHAWRATAVRDDGSIPADNTWWPAPNGFRSAGTLAEPVVSYGLVPALLEVCSRECDEGKVVVAARVENRGWADAPAGVELRLVGPDGEILARASVEAVPSGRTSEAVAFELAADAVREGFTLALHAPDLDLCESVTVTRDEDACSRAQ